MALSLSDLYSPQAQAIGAIRKPYKIPLASVIHSELPAKIEAGRNAAQTALYQKGLDQQQQAMEAQAALDTKSLALKKEEMERTLALGREQMEASNAAAGKSEKIQLGSLALQGGLGLAKLYGSGDLGKAGSAVESGVNYAGEAAGNLFSSILGAGTEFSLSSFFG